MIRKKYVVQKSFRLDAKLSDDLELLSEMLQRSQSEVFHMALESMMKEHAVYFAMNRAYENLLNWTDGGCLNEGDSTILEKFGTNTISAKFLGGDDEFFLFTLSNDDGVVDSIKYEGLSGNIKECLRNWSDVRIDDHDVSEYLKHRLNYR